MFELFGQTSEAASHTMKFKDICEQFSLPKLAATSCLPMLPPGLLPACRIPSRKTALLRLLLPFFFASVCSFPIRIHSAPDPEISVSRDLDLGPFLEPPKTRHVIYPNSTSTLPAKADVNHWFSPIYPYIFGKRLPIPEPLAPLTTYTNETSGETFDFYEITIKPLTQQIYPHLEATKLEGYNGQVPGPHIQATVGRKAVVRFINQLSKKTSVHLHGSPTRAAFDGWAEDVISPGEYKDYVYPNEDARTVWYHDHAEGITAINVYMGHVGTYWIIDPIVEAHFMLPQGQFEVPLVLTDRRYSPNGQLWQHIGKEDSEDENQNKGEASWTSFYGDIIHVNGMPWPYMDCEPRKYRFRLLNASVSRSYNLTIEDNNGKRIPFYVIGTDSGFMERPVETFHLTIGVAERYEIIVDFAYNAGQILHMKNARNFSQNADYPFTHFVMQFVVATIVTHASGNGPLPVKMVDFDYPPDPHKIDRFLQFEHQSGLWHINDIGFTNKTERVLATPPLGGIEVWELENTGGIWAHPVHIHLIDFKVLSRRGGKRDGIVEPWEEGFKDVVFVAEMEIVKVIARFQPWSGLYMFHCHNLVHEDHDMMAAFNITDSSQDIFSDPMSPLFRPKQYTGTDLAQIKEELLPWIDSLRVYPEKRTGKPQIALSVD